MDKIFKNGHAELAPLLSEREEQWYLPTFGVYHPKKPNQIRVVFDSSAQHNGVSLNEVLLIKPGLTWTTLWWEYWSASGKKPLPLLQT